MCDGVSSGLSWTLSVSSVGACGEGVIMTWRRCGDGDESCMRRSTGTDGDETMGKCDLWLLTVNQSGPATLALSACITIANIMNVEVVCMFLQRCYYDISLCNESTLIFFFKFDVTASPPRSDLCRWGWVGRVREQQQQQWGCKSVLPYLPLQGESVGVGGRTTVCCQRTAAAEEPVLTCCWHFASLCVLADGFMLVCWILRNRASTTGSGLYKLLFCTFYRQRFFFFFFFFPSRGFIVLVKSLLLMTFFFLCWSGFGHQFHYLPLTNVLLQPQFDLCVGFTSFHEEISNRFCFLLCFITFLKIEELTGWLDTSGSGRQFIYYDRLNNWKINHKLKIITGCSRCKSAQEWTEEWFDVRLQSELLSTVPAPIWKYLKSQLCDSWAVELLATLSL